MSKTDSELLDWLENNAEGYALVSDDNGHWACVCDGIQNMVFDDKATDMETFFWIEKDKWCNSVREAILSAIDEDEQCNTKN